MDHLCNDLGRRGLRRALAAVLAFPVRLVDLTITAANVTPGTGATQAEAIAGVTITAGQTIYLDASDANKAKLADANASALTAAVVGVSLHAALAGQPIKYVTAGNLNLGAILTVGETYILSATAGGIAPVADSVSTWFTSHLGIATTASVLKIQLHVSGVAKA